MADMLEKPPPPTLATPVHPTPQHLNALAESPKGPQSTMTTLVAALKHLAYLQKHALPNDEAMLEFTKNVLCPRLQSVHTLFQDCANFKIACNPIKEEDTVIIFHVISCKIPGERRRLKATLCCNIATDKFCSKDVLDDNNGNWLAPDLQCW